MQRFMQQHDARAERATRDIVSRAIFAEMRAGNTTPNGGVYLTLSHLGADEVRKAFKGMVERCADCGFDLAGGMVEVVPTAHYMMGGVLFNGDCSTSLPGLFAAGEDTGGVHGANRLGGNGVANSTVFGGIAGDTMAAWVRAEGAWRAPDEAALQQAIAIAEKPFSQKPGNVEEIREALLECMWEDVGIVRDAEGLTRAAGRLNELDDQLSMIGMASDERAFNLTWHDWLNLSNLILVSQSIQSAAAKREESRGAHFRQDFPQPRFPGRFFIRHRALRRRLFSARRATGALFARQTWPDIVDVMIVISEFMDDSAVQLLRADFDVLHDASLVDRAADLHAAMKLADALIVRNRTQVDAALIASAPRLKVVGRLGVGLDNIDTAACSARGIEVIPATGANAVSVAEYVVTTAMMLLRGVYSSSAEVAAGRWPRAQLSHGRELRGKTLGLIGFGSIGRITARLARNLGMNVDRARSDGGGRRRSMART